MLAGIEQAGPSFQLRVFVNNPNADADTDPSPAEGFAGSIYVYGYGVPPPGHEHIRMTRYIVATEAVHAAAAKGSTATVTLVPVAFSGDEPDVDLSNVEISLRMHQGGP